MKRLFGVLLAILMVSTLSACGYVPVEAGTRGVVQDGGLFPGVDPVLTECLEPETNSNQIFNTVYMYPARQISYEARPNEGSERGPFIVVSSAEEPAELEIPLTVTLDLTSDCDELKDFHRKIGTKYQAWTHMDGVPNDNGGWVSLLHYAIGEPTEITLQRLAQKYPWRQIWNDDEVRQEFEQELQKQLPARIQQRVEGPFIKNVRVSVGKPDPVDDGLKAAIAAEQKAVAEANAAREGAEARVAQAQAETREAQERALQRAAEIAGYPDVESYLQHQLIQKGGNPYQPTYVVPQNTTTAGS